MNFLLVYCKDCFDHIHDYVIEVLAASVHAEFKTKYVGAGAAVEYAVLNLKKHYKEELLKIKQKLAEASGTSLEDIQVPLTVQMSIFIDKKKKRGGLGCSLNVGSSSHATSVGESGEEVHMLRGQVNQLQATVNKLLRSVKRITARCAANFPPDDADDDDDAADDDDSDDSDGDSVDGDDFNEDIQDIYGPL